MWLQAERGTQASQLCVPSDMTTSYPRCFAFCDHRADPTLPYQAAEPQMTTDDDECYLRYDFRLAIEARSKCS